MQIDQDIESWLRLGLTEGVGGGNLRRLLVAFGDPAEVLAASQHALEGVVKKPLAASIFLRKVNEDKFARTIEWLKDPLNSLITLADSDYPDLLLNIPDPPPILYFKGQREFLTRPALAIVGSRNATPQGLANADAFAEAASNAGFCVISGLAQGIDTAAHQGGLRGASSSMAVIGTGLDLVYPSRNRELAHKLADEGALISEFHLGVPAMSKNFPRRNRIISGMCHACLVVEATLYSGSLITARLALEQGRDVMAIPGSIHSPLSKGCHALIKQGAKLVESIQDILDELNHQSIQLIQSVPADRNGTGGSAGASDGCVDDTGLLMYFDYDSIDIDALCTRSGLTVEVVSAMLLTLELEGRVGSLPGGKYQRIC
ncbi:DNA-protecting protein DprA [Nitrosomonas sp. HPC101]|uniref:DNA-processing protein DprA n=1 Tax=Nitrosomonas sp. HPC101 TaxID=1658667 RepID=UPI00136C6B8E|nr:DNA-processing protein DprA [Nitrosomonas sp. HPC101]MXS84820.1 DNA-protecting protein DprA [Nitrosomonas sp. HPC101]